MTNSTIKPRKDQSILSSLCANQIQIDKLNIPRNLGDLRASSLIAIWFLTLLGIEAVAVSVLANTLLGLSVLIAFPVMLMLWGGIGNQCIILLHEASHRTLMSGTYTNQNIGFFLGSIVGLNFKAFTKSHMQHHKLNGQIDDQEVYQLQDIDGWYGVLKYLFSPPKLSSVLVTPLSNRTIKDKTEFPLHLLCCAAFHSLFIYAQYNYTDNIYLSVLFTLSIPTTAIFFRKMRVLSEHCNHIGKTEPITRSHKTQWLDSYFFNGFGMNWHVEHHLYPNVPGYRLHKVNAYLCNEQGFSAILPSGSVLKTLISVLQK